MRTKITRSSGETVKDAPERIVGLFARGREIGFSLLERGELVRYGVKSVKGIRRGPVFEEWVRDTLSPLLALPEALIIAERIPATAKPGALCAAMSRQLEWQNSVRSLPMLEAKRRLCGNGKVTHRDLTEAVAERYPILRTLLATNAQKAKYWERMFLALALAETVKSLR